MVFRSAHFVNHFVKKVLVLVNNICWSGSRERDSPIFTSANAHTYRDLAINKGLGAMGLSG